MNKDVKELWIAALKSGEYKQGKGSLKRSNGSYCCLGVLCDVYAKETNLGFWKDSNVFQVKDTGNLASALLPNEVSHWADITCDAQYKTPNITEYECLVTDNDAGTPFKEIAEIIKNNF